MTCWHSTLFSESVRSGVMPLITCQKGTYQERCCGTDYWKVFSKEIALRRTIEVAQVTFQASSRRRCIVKTEVSRLLPNPPVSHFPEEVRMLALITSINTMQSLHDVASPTQRLTSEGKAPRNLLSTLQPDRRSVQDVECLPQPAPYFEPVSI